MKDKYKMAGKRKTLKIRVFDNFFYMYAIFTSIRFVRQDTNLNNKYHYMASNKVKKMKKKFIKNILFIFHP